MDFFPAAGSKLEMMKGTTLVLVWSENCQTVPRIQKHTSSNDRYGAEATFLNI